MVSSCTDKHSFSVKCFIASMIARFSSVQKVAAGLVSSTKRLGLTSALAIICATPSSSFTADFKMILITF